MAMGRSSALRLRPVAPGGAGCAEQSPLQSIVSSLRVSKIREIHLLCVRHSSPLTTLTSPQQDRGMA